MSDPLLAKVLDAIRAKRADARAHGVDLIGVIGSVARGEAQAESDVDVAYGLVGRASLFDLGGILMDLQDELGRRVDLVDLAQVKPRLRVLMERDLVRA